MNEQAKNTLVVIAAVALVSTVGYVLWLVRQVNTERVNQITAAVERLMNLIPKAEGGGSPVESSYVNPVVVAIGVLFLVTAWSLMRLKKT